MGEVYRARDVRLGRDVALKILPETLSRNSEALKRFQREAKSLAALSHPNILSVYDTGTDHEISYVVTEYLQGETLREHLTGSPFPWQKAAAIAATVAEALAEAHAHGIVHRDLKPGNIFITKKEQIKILDFGLARFFEKQANPEEGTTVSVEGTVVGTVPYMSPEQVRGDIVDSRSDIFSLGCVLYELITAKRCFSGKARLDTAAAVLKDEVPRPSAIGVAVPPELEEIILRCLEKDRENRFQSARDLGFALESVIRTSAAADRIISTGVPVQTPKKRLGIWSGAVALLIAVTIGWLFFYKQREFNSRSTGATRKIESLAVLPLLNLSRNSEQDYLADGMTEQLIASISRLKDLRVISRTSSMSYKNAKKALPQIAKELNVDAILEGSVLKSGNRIQFTVQLVHAATDDHLWAETYQRDLQDILTVQNELAEAIANEIQIQLTPQEQQQLANRKQVNPEAHLEYLKGRFYLAKFTDSDLKSAIQFFQGSLRKDPGYAPAYAGIADAYTLLSDNFLPPIECMPKARAAALKALELNPSLSEAHTSLATVKFYYDWDWAATNEELLRALDLNPNYAEAHRIRAAYLTSKRKRDEALSEIKKALELDPFSFLINMDVAFLAYFLRENDLSIRYLENALELLPSSQSPRAVIVLVLVAKGDLQGAAKADDLVDKKALLEEAPLYAAVLASAEAIMGRKKEAEEYLLNLKELSKRRFVCPYEIATALYSLGRTDEAFQYLEQAYHHRSICMVWLRVDPRFESLQSDPRYQDLMRRVRL